MDKEKRYNDLCLEIINFRNDHKKLRLGQAAFNYICRQYKGVAEKIQEKRPELDPFYNDNKVESFLRAVVDSIVEGGNSVAENKAEEKEYDLNLIKDLEFPIYTNTDKVDDAIKVIAESPDIFDITMVPIVPMISYYNPDGEMEFQSRRENVFSAVELFVNSNNYQGWYCTVQGEYEDPDDKKKGLKKFYFNHEGKHVISDWVDGIFQFPWKVVQKLKQLQ